MKFEGAESRGKGSYEIYGPPKTRPTRSKTRDLIISRTIQFANHAGFQYFWIDQDCVDQEDPSAKQTAMDSMDLVYKEAMFSIGLLSTLLRDEKDLGSLHALLFRKSDPDGSDDGLSDGPLTTENGLDSLEEIESLVDLLWRLHDDRWWSRQWIFQEEYLAGMNMYLLMRHGSELEHRKRSLFPQEESDELQNKRYRPFVILINGELSIQAVRLRRQATLLLTTMLQNSEQRIKNLHDKCRSLWKLLANTMSCKSSITIFTGEPCLPRYSLIWSEDMSQILLTCFP